MTLPGARMLASLITACLLGATLVGASWTLWTSDTAHASVQQIFDGPNDTVSAIAIGDDGTAYLGGSFTAWGPQTGGGALTDAVTAAVDRSFPPVDGWVYAVVSDGAGGWYIGGTFSQVGGKARLRLAHILPSGAVDDSWVPQASGPVYSLVRSGSVIYAGGGFGMMCGTRSSCDQTPQSRSYLAAINSDGTLSSWNPKAGAAVLGLAISGDGSTIYAGGDFTTMCGAGSSCDQTPQSRSYLAAIGADGSLGAWSPTPGAGRDSNTWVRSLAVSGSRVYVGGNFTTMNGSTRRGLAAVSAAGVLDASWTPSVTGGYPDVQALAVSPDESTVYIGGDFATINSSSRSNLGAVNASDGATTAWNPNPNAKIWGIAATGSTVYAAGEFSTVCGTGSSCDQSNQTRSKFAAFGVDGSLKSWHPNANGTGYRNTVAVSGSTVYLGGTFITIGTTSRSRLAAVSRDGTLTSWNPAASNTVTALAISGSMIYAGGTFTSIGGVTRNRLAAIGTDGTLSTWDPDANNTVNTLAVSGSTVYAGGSFTTIGGVTRNRLAAIGADGTLGSWDPNAGGAVNALAISGSTIYAGGSFTTIAGATRNRVAAIGADGTLGSWNPNANNTVNTLAISGSTVYAGGSFTTIAGVTRNRLAAINSSGGASSWRPEPNNSVNVLSIAGSTVYVGGIFSSFGSGTERLRLGAVTTGSQSATSWNPTSGGTVNALATSGGTVYVGGSFVSMDVNRGGAAKVAYFALVPTGAPGTPGIPTAVAGDTAATVTVTPPSSGGTPTSYTVTSNPGSSTCSVTGSSGSCTVTGLSNGQAYTFTSTATNTLGTSGASSSSLSVTPRTLPGAPSGVTGTPGNGQVAVSWSAPVSDGGDAISDYVVQWRESAGPGAWNTFADDSSTATTATVTGLTNGTGYDFRVAAVNDAGTGTYSSSSSSIVPVEPPPPPPSMSPSSQVLAGQVGVPVVPTSGFTLFNFSVMPRFVMYPPLPAGLSMDPLTGVVSGTPSEVYSSSRHWITATANGNAESAFSTLQVSVAAGVPSSPRDVVAVPGDSSVVVSWKAPESDGGSPLSGYVATASPGGQACTTSDALTCTITGLANGMAYSVQVTAANATGSGPAGQGGPVTPRTVPSSPRDVVAVPGDRSVVVSWKVPESDGGSPLTGYVATASPGGQACTTSDALTCTIFGLANGTAYSVEVTAANAAGSGLAGQGGPVTPIPRVQAVTLTALDGGPLPESVRRGSVIPVVVTVMGARGEGIAAESVMVSVEGSASLPDGGRSLAVTTDGDGRALVSVVAGESGAFSVAATAGGITAIGGPIGIAPDPSIAIMTSGRDVQDRQRVFVNLQTEGMPAGSELHTWVAKGKACLAEPGRVIVSQPDGTATWSRRARSELRVWFTYGEVTSATVTLPALTSGDSRRVC